MGLFLKHKVLAKGGPFRYRPCIAKDTAAAAVRMGLKRLLGHAKR